MYPPRFIKRTTKLKAIRRKSEGRSSSQRPGHRCRRRPASRTGPAGRRERRRKHKRTSVKLPSSARSAAAACRRTSSPEKKKRAGSRSDQEEDRSIFHPGSRPFDLLDLSSSQLVAAPSGGAASLLVGVARAIERVRGRQLAFYICVCQQGRLFSSSGS